jgi:hypothetical protein
MPPPRLFAIRANMPSRMHPSGTPVADPSLNSTYGMHPAMSFKRRSPNPIVATAIGALVGLAIVGGAVSLLALPAMAQSATSAAHVSGEFEHTYGYGDEQPSFNTATRDASGNRVFVEGRIMTTGPNGKIDLQ